MPPPERSFLKQRAILWEYLRADDYAEPVLAPPREIRCRWSNVQTMMLDAQNNNVAVDATVVVAEEIAEGSILWEGGFADLPGSGTGTGTDARPEGDLMEVKLVSTRRDLRGRIKRVRLGLSFFGDTLPGFS